MSEPEAPIVELPEFALQVVPVGHLDPSQIIGGLRAPPGFDPEPLQIMPIELLQRAGVGELTTRPVLKVAAACFVWRRYVRASDAKR